MKLKRKKIDLKERTLKGIIDNPNEQKIRDFTNYISLKIDKANYLITHKIENLDSKELYKRLKTFFDIYVNPEDYLKVLSKMNNKHYVHFIHIKTNMVDKDGNTIEYFGAATSPIMFYQNSHIDLKTIRKITNSNEFFIIQTAKTNEKLACKEKYENHQQMALDITNSSIDEESILFPYLIELLKKSILIKEILYNLKLYINELQYQANCITSLSKDKDSEYQEIGEKYQQALIECYETKPFSRKRRIPVSRHNKKVKK